VSGIADPFNNRIDEFRVSHIQRSDGWIETTWNNMSDPGAFAVAAAEEEGGGGGNPPPLAGAGVVVMGRRRAVERSDGSPEPTPLSLAGAANSALSCFGQRCEVGPVGPKLSHLRCLLNLLVLRMTG
jgi:hypothetical protein